MDPITPTAAETAAKLDALPAIAKQTALDNAALVHEAILALEAGEWHEASRIARKLAELADDVNRWAFAKAKPSRIFNL